MTNEDIIARLREALGPFANDRATVPGNLRGEHFDKARRVYEETTPTDQRTMHARWSCVFHHRRVSLRNL